MEEASTSVMSKKREDTAAKIITAIKESKGLLTMAAKRAGVSYTTMFRYTRDFPTVKQAVEESKESMLDFAEGKLYQAINEGNMTAIIFFLKTKGKERGYVERSEFTGGGENTKPIRIEVVSPEAKKLTEELCNGGQPVSTKLS